MGTIHRLHHFLPLLVASLFLMQGAASANSIYVFLLGGQSNMDGRAAISGLPANLQNPQPQVQFYYPSTLTTLRPESSIAGDFGPEVTFGQSMNGYYQPTNSIALIKSAAGGTNLYSQWAAGGTSTQAGDGPIYVNFQNAVSKGMAALQAANPGATLVLAGMIWMQGESDAVIVNGVDESLNYQANLTNFIKDIRLTYGANLPFVIGELSVNQTGTGPTQQRNNVRAAQVAVAAATPNCGIVNTDSFPLNSDSLHFNTVGQEDLGSGFAAAMQQLMLPSFDEVQFSTGTITNDTVLARVGSPSQEAYGVNMGSATGTTTANQYVFDSGSSTHVSYNVPGNYLTFLSGGGTTGDAGFDSVLNPGNVGGGGNGTLVLKDLSPGMEYRAMFMLADTRSGVGSRVFSVTLDGVTSASQTYTFIGGTGGVGGYVLCSFVALSATETFTIHNADGYQLNAVLVCQAGEPAPSFEFGSFSNNSVLSIAGTPSQELYGVNLNSTTAVTTANQYTFATGTSTNIAYNVPGHYGAFLSGGGTTGDAAFNSVLNTGNVGGGGNGTLTLNNLTPGTVYKALILLADTRSGVGTRTFSVTKNGATSPSQLYSFIGGSGGMGGYVLVTFIAGSSSEAFTVNSGSYGYQLDGVVVYVDPNGS